MNKDDLLYLTAYTGVLLTDFESFHEFTEKIMDRPVWTTELASEVFWDELKEKVEPTVKLMCKQAEENKECSWGPGVDVKLNGISVEPCVYKEVGVYHGATVIVSKCKKCGKIDISWVPGEGYEYGPEDL